MTTDPAYGGYRQWKGWDKLFSAQLFEIELFNREFSGIPLQGRRLLDVGFGSGSLLDWARRQGAEVEGVELQEELREAAQREGITASPTLEELDSGRFDIISLFDVLEHVPREAIPNLLQSVHRISRSNAHILIRVPNCQSPLGLLNQLGDATHVTMLSGPVVCQLLQSAGFKILEVRNGVNPNPPGSPIKPLFRFFQRILQTIFMLIYRLVWSTGATPLGANVSVHAIRT